MNVDASLPAPPRHRGDRLSRWFLALLVAGLIFAGGFCAIVFNNVRRTAAETDDCLRLVAWRVLSYADTHAGIYPVSAEALDGIDTMPALDGPAAAEGAWPGLLVDALGSPADPARIDGLLAMAAERVEIGFDPAGHEPPHLSGRGYPSTHGVIEEVNDWLYAQYASYRELDR